MLNDATQLAELGYSVFPCAVGAKTPLTPHGFHDATTSADQIEAWWSATPDANLALSTAGLLVVDVDGAGNPWPSDPEKALDLAAAPTSRTPRGGRHYFFRDTDQRFRCTTSKLAPSVDTRANGGYVLLPPSAVNGSPYQWVSGCLDVPPDRLPEPPVWLVEAIERAGTAVSVRVDASHPLTIPDGQRNATLTSMAGTMRERGMGESAILAALREDNRERCRPPLADGELQTIARSIARYAPGEAALATATSQVDLREVSSFGEPEDPGPFPPALLNVGGFLGGVADFSMKTAFVAQPELGLAAALPLLGTLTGRKIADPFGTRTNIYTIGVCESGGGKERARQVIKDILFEAGLRKMIGPEGFASSTGIVNAVSRQPALLFAWDEIGRLLKAASNPQAGAHLYHVPTVMMKLFTSSNSLFTGDAYADANKNIEIIQPHASLYGTTVPQSFLEGLSTESITNGFLSRMLVFESSNGDPEPQIPVVTSVPAELVAVARFWADFQAGKNLADVTPQPQIVEYTEEAKAIMVDLRALARLEKQAATGPYRTLWTRTGEIAHKLALLWACSANHQRPIVDAQAARWSADVSQYMTRRLAYLASRWISENRQESDTKRLQRIIEDAGPEGISKRDLIFATRWLSRRDRDEAIMTLLEAGSIFAELVETKTKPRLVYRAAKYAAVELL